MFGYYLGVLYCFYRMTVKSTKMIMWQLNTFSDLKIFTNIYQKPHLLDVACKTQVILVNFASCQFEEIEMIETRLT